MQNFIPFPPHLQRLYQIPTEIRSTANINHQNPTGKIMASRITMPAVMAIKPMPFRGFRRLRIEKPPSA